MDIEKLEKVQLNAARIVTGLTSFASRNSIYFETGWEPLEHRINRAILITMYKMHNNLVPTYIQNIVPYTRGSVSRYTTRNSLDYSVPKLRLDHFNKSFIPDTVRRWNTIQGRQPLLKYSKNVYTMIR